MQDKTILKISPKLVFARLRSFSSCPLFMLISKNLEEASMEVSSTEDIVKAFTY